MRSSPGGLPHPPVVNNPTHLRSFIALVLWGLNDFHRSCTPQPHVRFCYPNDTHALFASAPPDSHVRITGTFVQACCSHCIKVSWHFKHAHSFSLDGSPCYCGCPAGKQLVLRHLVPSFNLKTFFSACPVTYILCPTPHFSGTSFQ